MTSLRDLPSVEQLMQSADHLIQEYGRPLTLDAFRLSLDEARTRLKAKPEAGLPSTDVILVQTESPRRMDSIYSTAGNQRDRGHPPHQPWTGSFIKSNNRGDEGVR